MAEYYQDHPLARPQQANTRDHANTAAKVSVLSEYDKVHETLLTDDAEEGWASELRHYLKSMDRVVTKDTDIVEWWQVSCFWSFRQRLVS